MATALSLRVGLLHLILDDRQCKVSSVEVSTLIKCLRSTAEILQELFALTLDHLRLLVHPA